MTLRAIKYGRGKLEILDQLLLPHKSIYVEIKNLSDAWNAIKTMQVRGAPAIAIVGCLALAVELRNNLEKLENYSKNEFSSKIKKSFEYLLTARPTAVNLHNEAMNFTKLLESLCGDESSLEIVKQKIIDALENIYEADLAINKKLALFGALEILKEKNGDQKLTILTHCNTGSLATAGYGTALGIIRKLAEQNRLEMVFFTETRPYNQGARLTAYELKYENIPSTMICDSTAGWLMKTQKIDAVVTGADRVALNGDTANKIGTYALAVLAQFHGVPFYVACPASSFHAQTPSGAHIVVEQRPGAEMTCGPNGEPVTPPGTQCWNPAFDVTPAHLVKAVVTEFGAFEPQHLEQAYRTDWKTHET